MSSSWDDDAPPYEVPIDEVDEFLDILINSVLARLEKTWFRFG